MEIDLSTESKDLPHSICCECGETVNAASGPSKPSPNDLSVCAYCGCLNVFDKDLTLRKPTDEELFVAAKLPELQAIRRAVERLARERRARDDR